jgi:hypothetical protein
MEKSTQIKTVICGVALVALASVRPALAQDETTGCPPLGSGSGVGLCITQTFGVGDNQTNKYDFGTHAIKITVNVDKLFDLQVGFIPITQDDLRARVNTELGPADFVDCIPYDGKTSDTDPAGTCGFYHVFNPLPEKGVDYHGDVLYKVLWDFPTLALLHNVRLYRAPLDGNGYTCSGVDNGMDGFDCYTQNITEAVFAIGDSNSDAGVSGRGTGFSDFEAVDLTSPTSSGARVWIGLKNSDDVGTRFDLRADVRKGTGATPPTVSSGQLFGALGGSSGFTGAKLRTIPLSPSTPFTTGDTMSLEVFVRNSCVGTSHNSGIARLWFNDGAANSRVSEPKSPTESTTLYLVMPSATLELKPVAGSGPKKTKDVFVGARDLSCNGPWTSFGTWTGTVPP